MVEHGLLGEVEVPDMASVPLAPELYSVHTKSSCTLDMPQGSLEERISIVAWAELENPVVPEVQVVVVVVEGCEVQKQPLHSLDLFEVGLVHVVVVVNPFYKKKKPFNTQR